MALDEIRRILDKVTYAPIRPSSKDEETGATSKRRRGFDKLVFAGALHAPASEIEAVKAMLDPSTEGDTIAALDAIKNATSRSGSVRAGWRILSTTPVTSLVAAGRALAKYRRTQRSVLRGKALKLAIEYDAFVRDGLPKNPPIPVASPWTPEPNDDPRLSASALKSRFAAALDWARVLNPARADDLARLARQVTRLPVEFSNLTAIDWDRFTDAVVSTLEDTPEWTEDLTDGFEERMKVEPIGRLHLERIEMTPVGVIRGELMHSVGLAPKETVTLIHREWSSRETSFEKVVTDEFEQSTEEGVTENTDLANSTETQSRHSSALSMEASGSGSWGFASASATVGYNSTSDDETTKRDSRNQTIEITRKASSRTRKEHKVTFTVKQQAGVEDQSVRTLTNPSPRNPMRIDFHQMVRNWRVDLYRYGLRLTYDIVVPSPGIDLITKISEIHRIEYQLEQPFLFTLKADQITRKNWTELAALYSAEVTPPDPKTILLLGQVDIPQDPDDFKVTFNKIEIDVPPGYFALGGEFFSHMFFRLDDDPADGRFNLAEDGVPELLHTTNYLEAYVSRLDYLKGRTGKIVLLIYHWMLEIGYGRATIEAAQTEEAWHSWQTAAWTELRKGAEALWKENRQNLQDRRDRLREEVAQWDPLTLRRMEREEVMKATLKWIFGPAFDLMPSDLAQMYQGRAGELATIEPSRLTIDQWSQIMGLGEFIKFLHEAIEWENVLFFVYPYFWDHPRNHALKRFLYHPDNLHQTFLRGGAARVVLTVRPGFEESFTKLIESGNLDEDLGDDHPYMTIAEEIRAYAKTHYPGIPPSTPGHDPSEEEVDKAQRGERIARWHEYSPISALDMTINTDLDDLK
jgi:hypothetical protein